MIGKYIVLKYERGICFNLKNELEKSGVCICRLYEEWYPSLSFLSLASERQLAWMLPIHNLTSVVLAASPCSLYCRRALLLLL